MFSSIVENVDIWRIPLETNGAGGPAPLEKVTDDAAVDQMMNATRDGTVIVFISDRTKRDEVWLRDMTTGRERQLTFDGAVFARISPDGTRVAVVRSGPRRSLEIVPSTGGAATKICEDCHVDDWFPDGSQLLLHHGQPGDSKALYVHDLEGGHETTLTRHPIWNLYRGRVSPDANWVVFNTANSATLRQVYAVPAAGPVRVPEDRWVPVVADFGIQPSWSPDGRGIYHFSHRDGSFCGWVQLLDRATAKPLGEPRVVQHLHEPRLRAVSGAIVNNDVRGNHWYVTLTETTGNLWMLRE
ncbi:MAG: hypothetical protein M3468_02595 [Acidobacteriota bacterium]|nr:hypothetical protein [Acidobacteriota bacterium]